MSIERGSTHPSGVPRPNVAKVMFVDDETAILASLQSLFRKEGYSLVFFSDPRTALNHLASTEVDIIVSDLRMPEMSGIEFLNHASSVCPDAIRIMLSGFEDKTLVLNALAKGLARDYVMKPWEDGPFRKLIADSVGLLEGLHEQRLRKILGSVDFLPSPPRYLDMLSGILGESDTSLKDIVAEVEKNPPLVARLLRVANSVHYGTRRSVTSVHDAVLFVGTEYVASLVLAIEAFEKIHGSENEAVRENVDALWNQALQRATIAKTIAENWDGFHDRHLAYVASLFQDIGLVVRACASPDAMKRFLELTETDGVPPMEADASIFGITHDEVGSALLQYWNFPPEIVSAVAGHHQPAGDDPLLEILQIAENLEWSSRPSVAVHPVSKQAEVWAQRLQHILTSRP